MKIIERTLFNRESSCVPVIEIDTAEEAARTLQALAAFAVSEIVTGSLTDIEKHRITVSDICARIVYPNGDILEYYIE